LVCVRLFQTFSFYFVFASVFCFFFPLHLRHSLYWFLHFLLPYSADFICRKNGANTESQSLLLPCFSSFFLSFLFFSFLSLLLPAFLISQQRKDKGRKSLCSLRFFSPNCLPLLHFLSFFFCFSPLFPQQKRLI